MGKKVRVRRYLKGDENAIVGLLGEVFSPDYTMEKWVWKYKNNPAGFYSDIWIAVDGERIVGYYALIPIRLKVKERILLCAQSVDTVTHSDYRGQGIFTKLAKKVLSEAADRGVPIIYGFPGRKSYGGFIKKLNWEFVDYVPVMFKVINFWRIFLFSFTELAQFIKAVILILRKNTLNERQRFIILDVRQRFLLLLGLAFSPGALIGSIKTSDAKGTNVRVMEVDRFDRGIDIFWSKIADDYDIIVKRDREYLNWRYVDNPEESFRILVARERDKIVGYIVLRKPSLKGGESIGEIMDLLSLPGRGDVTKRLIDEAVSYFRDREMTAVRCFMQSYYTHYNSILRERGFFSYKELFSVTSFFKINLEGMIPTLILYKNQHEQKLIDNVFDKKDRWFMSIGDKL